MTRILTTQKDAAENLGRFKILSQHLIDPDKNYWRCQTS